MTQTEVDPDGAVWRCRYGSGTYTMYHCFRECLGITTGKCNQCQDGYYGFNGNQTCSLCVAGSYCTDGVIQGDCDPGYYCELGASLPTQASCPPGTYGDTAGLTTASCSGLCDAGYYCNSGSTSATQFPCDAGQWGTQGETSSSCSGPCTAGYYCPSGSASAKQNECGAADRYCPEGADTFTSVQSGYYSTPTNVDEKQRTGEQICPQGSYCVAGVIEPCPAGRYSSSIGSTSCASNLCSAGFFCPAGSKSPNANPCYPDPLNPPTYEANYFCEEGTSTPVEVFDGYYSIPEDAAENQRTGQAYADPVLYTTKFGKRYRKIEWMDVCVGDAGGITIDEYTNHQEGFAGPGAQLSELWAVDNIIVENVTSFELLDIDSNLNDASCSDFFGSGNNPFVILNSTGGSDNANLLHVREDTFIDYELCTQYVLEIVAYGEFNATDSATCTLTVDVTNINDQPFYTVSGGRGPSYPNDEPSITTFSVKEREVKNQGVGVPIEVDDEDNGQEVYFEILNTLDGPEDMFYIGSCSGQLYVQKDTLDYRVKNEYNLQIRACDDPKFFDSVDFSCAPTTNITINVDDVNDVPYYSTSPEVVRFEVEENSAKYSVLTPICDNGAGEVLCTSIDASYVGLLVDDLDIGATRDSTTDVMTYTITRNDNDMFSISSCVRDNNLDTCLLPDGSANVTAGALLVFGTLDFETNQYYSIAVRANDGRGAEVVQDFSIQVIDVNDPPSWALSSTTISVAENALGDTDTVAAYDEDAGANLTYVVMEVRDADGNVVPSSGGQELFEIKDPAYGASGEQVTIQVTQGVDYEVSHYYSVVVECTDEDGASAQVTITAQIEDVNEAPSITTEYIYLPENLPFGSVLDTMLAFEDPDNVDSVVGDSDYQQGFFSLKAGSSSQFSVLTAGNITTTTVGLNYEDLTNYTLIAIVTDTGTPGISTQKTITMIVTDEPEPPTIQSGQTFTFTELDEDFDSNTMTHPDWNVTIVAYDEDIDDTLDMEIISQTPLGSDLEVNFFRIDGTTLSLNTSHPDIPDYESNIFLDSTKFEVVLRGTDSGDLYSEESVIIEVVNANDRPLLSDMSFTISEHNLAHDPCTQEFYCQPGNLVGYTYTYCTDADLTIAEMATEMTYAITDGNSDDTFELEDGVLRIKTISTNLQTEGHVFTLTVVATDKHPTNPLSSEPATVTVTVTELNYKPQVTDQSVTVDEDIGVGVGDFSQRVLIQDLAASDPENSELVYEIVSVAPFTVSSVFALSTNGTLYAIQAVDFESFSGGKAVLDIIVKDSGGIGNFQSSEIVVTINVVDLNETPEIEDFAFSVDENTAAAVIAGAVVYGTDQDANDTNALTYSLLTTNSQFSIGASDGVVSHDGTLDFENPKTDGGCALSSGLHTCVLSIRVTDVAGLTDDSTLTITVNNINEAPVLKFSTCYTSVATCHMDDYEIAVAEDLIDEESTQVKVAQFGADDPDGEGGLKSSFSALSYTLVGGELTDTGSTVLEVFLLDAVGNLYITSQMDYENASFYEVDVMVSDFAPTPLIDQYTVRVNVTDVNDIGMVSVTENGPWDTFGGENVTLYGDNFGPTEFKLANEPDASFASVRVYLGTEEQLNNGTHQYEASGCSIVSHEEILCTSTPPGVGMGFYWQVEILGWASEANTEESGQVTNYKQPTISTLVGALSLPVLGGATYTITGDNFGPIGTEVSSTYRVQSDTNLEFHTDSCAVTTASTEMECTSVVGIGTNLEFVVSVGGQASDWFQDSDPLVKYRYEAPAITAVGLLSGAAEMRTQGDSSDYLVLTGSGFGTISHTSTSGSGVVVQYGPSWDLFKYTATGCTVVTDFTTVRCQYVEGVGTDMMFTITVALISSSTSSVSLSYAGPSIYSISGAGSDNAATKGGDLVTITGESFGPLTTDDNYGDVRMFYGGADADRYEATGCIVVTAQTTVECFTAAGTGTNHPWKAVISGQESTLSYGLSGLGTSYAPPTVNRFIGDTAIDARTMGGEVVTLEGVNFGDGKQAVTATFGATGDQFDAQNCTVLSSYKHTRVQCELPPGIGKTLRWVVTVDGQSSRVPTTAYRAPIVSNITQLDGVSPLDTMPTTGDVWFALHGEDFGVESVHDVLDDYMITYGQVSGEEYIAQNCSIEADYPSIAHCRVVPGIGSNLKFVITVAGQKSPLSSVTASYSEPEIGSISPTFGITGPEMSISVNGSNFGPPESAIVTWNSVPLELSAQSHTNILFDIPEEMQRGSDNLLRIVVGDQVSSLLYDFELPVVKSISAVLPPFNFTGAEIPQAILIRGENFGVMVDGDNSITVGGVPCLVDSWDHTYIQCNTTVLTGEVEVIVGGQMCRMEDDADNSAGCCPCDFDYESLLLPPKLDGISICDTVVPVEGEECSTNGGYLLEIFGEDLGTSAYGRVEVDGNRCQVYGGDVNYTDVRIKCTVPPGEGSGEVVVYQAWKQTEEIVTFYYDAPGISGIYPSRANTAGGTEIHVFGVNFGVSGPNVYVGPNHVAVNSFDHNNIFFTLPPGEGIDEVRINVAGLSLSNGPHYFDYFEPNISYINPSHGVTQGGYELTITGDNFGTNGTVTIGTYDCPVSNYTHTEIVCLVPYGGGEMLDVVVHSGNRDSLGPHVEFTFDRPKISSITPEHGPTLGGEMLTIYGINFAEGSTARVGDADCEDLVVVAYDTIQCLVPPGINVNHTVVVELFGQESIEEVHFSYDPPVITSTLPNPMDGAGTVVQIFGMNFGDNVTDPDESFLSVNVSGTLCLDPIRVNDGLIQCDMPPVSVGTHPIEVHSAQQVSAPGNTVFSACVSGYYGQVDEMCTECPEGAECDGYVAGVHYDPRSKATWGSISRTEFRRCAPREACLGGDVCRLGYENNREGEHLCARCFRGNETHDVLYYRLEAICVECPRLAWLLFIGVLAATAALCALSYFLTKHGVQLAAVSIGIDFCQIVSLFATYDYQWPQMVMDAYAALSAFNLNLDLATPECSVGWDYQTKWQITFFSPVLFAGVFSASLISSLVRAKIKMIFNKIKRKWHNRKVKPTRHDSSDSIGGKDFGQGNEPDFTEEELDGRKLLVDDDDIEEYDASFNRFIDAEFGAFLIMCYYLYLSVMRKIFELFNCEDGYLVAESSIKCDSSDLDYLKLYSFSVIGLFAYGIGIPGLIGMLLFKHRAFIRRDQHRREADMSKATAAKYIQNLWRGYHVRRAVNPTAILKRHKLLSNIGRTRAKYGKLYEDFTGDCFYWRVLLLTRKLLLVIITMFGAEKYQQTCLAFGVLFTAYALQVKHRPYLSRYKTKSASTGLMTRKRSRGKLGFSKINYILKNRKAGGLDSDPYANVDRSKFQINKTVVERLFGAFAKSEEEPTDTTANDAEMRWGKLKEFVKDKSDDKFVIAAETATEMGEDMFRWLFDYNSLEAISLGSAMYVLLFGMLFDTYDVTGDQASMDFLGGVTITLFICVILVFASSVALDVYRKFLPKLRNSMICYNHKHQVVAFENTKTKTKADKTNMSSELARRGQWIAPVNPFATLAEQNATLIRAEEARIAAIMSRKMKHLQELNEREERRRLEKERLDREYQERMRQLDAEWELNEKRSIEEEEELEKLLEREAREKQRLIEEELQLKMDLMERDGLIIEDEDEKAALAEAERAQFELERELLLAQQDAKEQDMRAGILTKQNDEFNETLASMESEAETLFVGHREHQEELKARIAERRMRKVRRKKNKKLEDMTEEEKLIEQIEDKIDAMLDKHTSEVKDLETELQGEKEQKLEELQAQVKLKLLKQHREDTSFEAKLQKDLEEMDMELLRQESEIQEKISATDDEALKTEYREQLKALEVQRNEKRKHLVEAIEKKRQARLAEVQQRELEENDQRNKTIEESKKQAEEKRKEMLEVKIKQAEANEKSKEEMTQLKEEFGRQMKQFSVENEKAKQARREAVEKRIATRKKTLAKIAEIQELVMEKRIHNALPAITEGGGDERRRSVLKTAVSSSLIKRHESKRINSLQHLPEGQKEVEIQKRLEKMKQDAQAQREMLDRKLEETKKNQREKLRERLQRKKENAEKKKKEVLQEKKKVENQVEKKLQEEEEQMRQRHDKEIKEIEEARIEVLLDDNHAKSLAAGVQEWRKRKEKKGDPKGKANEPSKVRRSSILKQDFGVKVRRLEEMVAEQKAKRMEQQQKSKKSKSNKDEVKKIQRQMQKHIKDLNALYKSYEEEVEAEINKLANEAAVEKARQRRKIDMLVHFTDPNKKKKKKGIPTPVSPTINLPGSPNIAPPSLSPPGAGPKAPVMHVNLKGLSLKRLDDV